MWFYAKAVNCNDEGYWNVDAAIKVNFILNDVDELEIIVLQYSGTIIVHIHGGDTHKVYNYLKDKML